MMNKFADTLVSLRLLSTEFDTANREPIELTAYNRVDSGQKQEILAVAERLLDVANPYLEQVPVTPNRDNYDVAA